MKTIIEPFKIKTVEPITQSHIDYVAECIGEVFQKRDRLGGMRIVSEPPVLRHFTARFESIKN